MIISLIPWDEDSLLALALNSKIVKDGLSSINNGDDSRSETLIFNCCHSWSASLPVLSLSDDNPVSDEINLVISWTDDISSEKKATGIFCWTEIFLAIESANAVFPIPGLAAIITRSLGCHPDVSLSSFSKPVETPLRPSCFAISSILAFALITRFWADSVDVLIFPCATSYNLDSASSKRSITSVLSLYDFWIISLEIVINFLWIYFWSIILEWNSIWAEDETFWERLIK